MRCYGQYCQLSGDRHVQAWAREAAHPLAGLQIWLWPSALGQHHLNLTRSECHSLLKLRWQGRQLPLASEQSHRSLPSSAAYPRALVIEPSHTMLCHTLLLLEAKASSAQADM